jgi:hypothetical protein
MSDRPICDTPGCGRPIPVGGEGHPEICPACLDALRKRDDERAKRAMLAENSRSVALAHLRAAGWSVAVHSDYRQNGEHFTFWLFTHENRRWIKGEGRTDEEALQAAVNDSQRDDTRTGLFAENLELKRRLAALSETSTAPAAPLATASGGTYSQISHATTSAMAEVGAQAPKSPLVLDHAPAVEAEEPALSEPIADLPEARSAAHERLGEVKAVPPGFCEQGPYGPDWKHRAICNDLTNALIARDLLHTQQRARDAAELGKARKLLERLEAMWYAGDPSDTSYSQLVDDVRAFLNHTPAAKETTK